MKIRNGFVSNSSSSSFLIYGACISRSVLEAGLTATETPFDEDSLGYDGVAGLDTWRPEGYDEIFIGLSWDDVGDDETGKQFKDRIEQIVKKLVPTASCGTHKEAWYG